MDAVLLSRIQFALTASFHFIFPPISMGLGLLLVVLGINYVRTKDPKWRQMSFFWTSIYGLVFALGVATGVVQEFEFGMNWSNYSRFVGNVFGSLLAAEGVLAFFLEGSFLGLMLLGGNRLGPRMWLLATCLVVFGAHLSAVWIIMANSWMQTPAGYIVQATPAPARAYMTDFFQVLFTPSFIPRILHVWVSSWTVGAAIMLAVSSWYILRKRHIEMATANFKLALGFFVVMAALNLFVTGRGQVEEVMVSQPIKFAAFEGLWKTESCAPMSLLGWVDESSQRTLALQIPCFASFLVNFDINTPLTGLDAFPNKDLWPPVNWVFQTYHIMINLGVTYVGVGLLGVALYLWKRKVFEWRPVLWLFIVMAPLTELSIIAGWWTAEIGRQPWLVYDVMTTAQGMSPNLTATQVALSLITFTVLYTILGALFAYLFLQKVKHGPDPIEEITAAPIASLPDTFRDIFGRRSGDS
jgi:cytochrome d ubiquinol oxidase subunit I